MPNLTARKCLHSLIVLGAGHEQFMIWHLISWPYDNLRWKNTIAFFNLSHMRLGGTYWLLASISLKITSSIWAISAESQSNDSLIFIYLWFDLNSVDITKLPFHRRISRLWHLYNIQLQKSQICIFFAVFH